MNLTNIEAELFNSNDTEKLYDLLEMLYVSSEDKSEEILIVISNIFDTAMETVSNAFIDKKMFDPTDDKDKYVLRAVYEKAMGYYEKNDYYEAEKLFYLLSTICSDNDFRLSMQNHIRAMKKKIPLEKFIKEYVSDINVNEYFILNFKDKIRDLQG